MAYPTDTVVEAKRLFIQQGRTPAEIAALLGEDGPVAQTVSNWASAEDADGQTWYDLRAARAERLYQDTSPQSIARKLMEQIAAILHAPVFDTKKADALSKLTTVLRRITDARYQLSALYQALSDFALYLKEHHPDLLTPELIGALRGYKNELRRRLHEGE